MVCSSRKISVCATRITDLLFPLREIEQRFRHATLGAEKVDLEDDHIFARGVEHVFEGRIGNESAVPIGLTVDFDGREARRQSTARHDVLRTDRM
jgi:hypothetical protein